MTFDTLVQALTYAIGEAYVRQGDAQQLELQANGTADALEASKQTHDEDGYGVDSHRAIARRAAEKSNAEDKLIGQCETLLATIRSRNL